MDKSSLGVFLRRLLRLHEKTNCCNNIIERLMLKLLNMCEILRARLQKRLTAVGNITDHRMIKLVNNTKILKARLQKRLTDV